MWICLNTGFYSIVLKDGDTSLTVRARVAADLDRLRVRYMPALSPTVNSAQADYPCRATATHEEVAAALARAALDVIYPNHKDEIAMRQGAERARIYGEVWAVLRRLEGLDERLQPPVARRAAGKKQGGKRKGTRSGRRGGAG